MTAQKKWQRRVTLPKLKKQDPIVSADGSDKNLFAWLSAKAAERGHGIVKLPSGYLVHQWGQCRHCPTTESLINCLSRMGCDIPKTIASSATPERATGTFNHSKI